MFAMIGGFGTGIYAIKYGRLMDIKNWISNNVVHNSPGSKQKDMEILTDELTVYADWGRVSKQIKLPDGGSYLITGWYPSMQDGRSNVRLSRVPVDNAA